MLVINTVLLPMDILSKNNMFSVLSNTLKEEKRKKKHSYRFTKDLSHGQTWRLDQKMSKREEAKLEEANKKSNLTTLVWLQPPVLRVKWLLLELLKIWQISQWTDALDLQ